MRLDHFCIIIKLSAVISWLYSCNFLKFSSGFAEGETPVPIPNTAVKPFEADGTAQVIVWESRKLLV